MLTKNSYFYNPCRAIFINFTHRPFPWDSSAKTHVLTRQGVCRRANGRPLYEYTVQVSNHSRTLKAGMKVRNDLRYFAKTIVAGSTRNLDEEETDEIDGTYGARGVITKNA